MFNPNQIFEERNNQTSVDQFTNEGPTIPHMPFDILYRRHILWSTHTFGPIKDRGPEGCIKHLKKEIKELEENPMDLEEWMDALHLVLDGYWRAGGDPKEVLIHFMMKQRKNFNRDWPDWRDAKPGEPIEHVRKPDERNTEFVGVAG